MSRGLVVFSLVFLLVPCAFALSFHAVGNNSLEANLTIDSIGPAEWRFNITTNVPVNLSICISHNGTLDYCATNANYAQEVISLIGPLDANFSYDYHLVLWQEQPVGVLDVNGSFNPMAEDTVSNPLIGLMIAVFILSIFIVRFVPDGPLKKGLLIILFLVVIMSLIPLLI